ncbi:hypothetical protein DPMN_107064 [Dreissena polymorpha]|uniref:Uncharacterized protein n=1 Tax=Dreissena polymorpha TaxID=45954 RepID=A0A9D4K670_DREPO|nr:hypothetical protein DPMN_107064 [Dreissena polymorpha]
MCLDKRDTFRLLQNQVISLYPDTGSESVSRPVSGCKPRLMCCLSIPSHRSPEDVIGIEKQLERLLAFRDCLCVGETPEIQRNRSNN